MAEIEFKQIRKANVYLRDDIVGELEKTSDREHVFRYFQKYVKDPNAVSIARSLPKRKEPYITDRLHPFFDNLITEGWLLQYTEKIFHIDKANRFALLMATGRAPIGAVTVKPLDSNNQPIDVVEEFLSELNAEQLKKYPSLELERFPFCPTCFKSVPSGSIHKKCTLDMWGTTKQLQIEMDAVNPLSSFARVIYGGSISGAQKKGMFSLNLKTGLLTPTPSNARYILKPDGDYPELPVNEHVTMAIAKSVGFRVPPFTILKIENLGYVFAIKRFDRLSDGLPLMMEDMGQIVEAQSSDKYESTFERIAKSIGKYSSAPTIDLVDFYRRVVFCFLVANADMHLKNWTLVENSKALGTFLLAPCYDLLNTRLPIPQEKIDTGLKLLGKDRRLTALNFKEFGIKIDISKREIERTFNDVKVWHKKAVDFVGKSLLSEKSKATYLKLVNERFETLQKK